MSCGRSERCGTGATTTYISARVRKSARPKCLGYTPSWRKALQHFRYNTSAEWYGAVSQGVGQAREPPPAGRIRHAAGQAVSLPAPCRSPHLPLAVPGMSGSIPSRFGPARQPGMRPVGARISPAQRLCAAPGLGRACTATVRRSGRSRRGTAGIMSKAGCKGSRYGNVNIRRLLRATRAGS